MFWRRRKSRECDLERELRSHLEVEAEEQRDAGSSAEEACYAARRALGNTTFLKEEVRQMWGWTSVERVVQDIRYTGRLLRKNAGFAAVAIFSLAIGIGANTAIFSVMDAVLLRPLPIMTRTGSFEYGKASPGWAKVTLVRRRRSSPPIVIAPVRFRAWLVISRTASTLRTKANLSTFPAIAPQRLCLRHSVFNRCSGHAFSAQEELPGAAKVVILSYQFWRRHYAENPHVIGKIIRLNEQSYEIVGVMPRGLIFPSTAASPGEPPALWAPLSFTSNRLNDWASSFDTSMIAPLRDGISLAQAKDDVKRVAAQFQQEHPDIYSGNIRLDASADLWSPEFSGHVRIVLPMLGAAVGFLLLIACANVANLLLARAGARQREMSIRKALGASAGRVIRQVLTETAILTLAGGTAGCALAYTLLRFMNTVSINEVNIRAASIDIRVLLFTFAVCGITCLLCGIAPAWMFWSSGMHNALKQSVRQSGQSSSNRRLARSLMAAEIARCVVVLIGSGLLFRSFVRILEVPLGFNPQHTLIVRTTLNRQRYSPDRRHAVERIIEDRLSSLPGVSAVALTTHVPLADEREIGFVIDGQPPDEFHWGRQHAC